MRKSLNRLLFCTSFRTQQGATGIPTADKGEISEANQFVELAPIMSAHKIVVVDSEKSPKVCSTNWREDVILKKNLQVLDRSQRAVVNRIMVDQKILKRRFQIKVNRSKMSYARATSNVEMQKKLRDETTFVLNTNVGMYNCIY